MDGKPDTKPDKKEPSWLDLLFSPYGRIGRGTWWIFVASRCVVFPLIVFAAFNASGYIGFLLYPIVTMYVWNMIVSEIKRWHDLDKSGWWGFFALVPLIGFFYTFYKLGFCKGTYDKNKFGYPEPNREV